MRKVIKIPDGPHQALPKHRDQAEGFGNTGSILQALCHLGMGSFLPFYRVRLCQDPKARTWRSWKWDLNRAHTADPKGQDFPLRKEVMGRWGSMAGGSLTQEASEFRCVTLTNRHSNLCLKRLPHILVFSGKERPTFRPFASWRSSLTETIATSSSQAGVASLGPRPLGHAEWLRSSFLCLPRVPVTAKCPSPTLPAPVHLIKHKNKDLCVLTQLQV